MFSIRLSLLLVPAFLAICRGQDTSRSSCPVAAPRMYSLGDRIESVGTGAVVEDGYVLQPEASVWCQDPASYRYRTFDGTCNHPRNLGAASKPLDNLLPPDYEDGVNSPRQRGKDGQPLPSARNVSFILHTPKDNFANHPGILMQWGQWIAHDVVATAVPSGRPSCCGPQGGCPPFVTDVNCLPIRKPDNDTAFPGICINFVRSLAANDSNNKPSSPRQQINSVTSFHDCSQIYGSSPDTAASIRVPDSYLLLTKGNNFLPESKTSGCILNGTDEYCFLAGDLRVNQHPYLSTLNTIWVREHNRVAQKLRDLSPASLSNEVIFQKARKIIIGMNQVVTFNFYLPIILGNDAVRWGLTSTSGRSYYNPGLNPSSFTAFTTAAFRFGHSTVPSGIAIGDTIELLRNLFNRPGPVLKRFDDVVAGMAGVSSASQKNIQSADRNFVEDISRFLFMNPTTGQGSDLVSINIQRGRDHGLAPYVIWRQFCGLGNVTGFEDEQALGPNVRDLAKVYRSIEDVDLYTGMLFEPVQNGFVGPTCACLLRMQFSRYKFGDRMFFDNDERASAFTDAQLASIRSTTLARVLCFNSNVASLPRDVFKFSSYSNPMVNCSVLKNQDLNFSLFL